MSSTTASSSVSAGATAAVAAAATAAATTAATTSSVSGNSVGESSGFVSTATVMAGTLASSISVESISRWAKSAKETVSSVDWSALVSSSLAKMSDIMAASGMTDRMDNLSTLMQENRTAAVSIATFSGFCTLMGIISLVRSSPSSSNNSSSREGESGDNGASVTVLSSDRRRRRKYGDSAVDCDVPDFVLTQVRGMDAEEEEDGYYYYNHRTGLYYNRVGEMSEEGENDEREWFGEGIHRRRRSLRNGGDYYYDSTGEHHRSEYYDSETSEEMTEDVRESDSELDTGVSSSTVLMDRSNNNINNNSTNNNDGINQDDFAFSTDDLPSGLSTAQERIHRRSMSGRSSPAISRRSSRSAKKSDSHYRRRRRRHSAHGPRSSMGSGMSEDTALMDIDEVTLKHDTSGAYSALYSLYSSTAKEERSSAGGGGSRRKSRDSGTLTAGTVSAPPVSATSMHHQQMITDVDHSTTALDGESMLISEDLNDAETVILAGGAAGSGAASSVNLDSLFERYQKKEIPQSLLS